MSQSNPVQSLVRGMRIMEAVAEVPDGLSLAAIAKAVDIKTTTAHNLVKTLAQLGYLARQSNPTRYLAGPALAALAQSSGIQRGQETQIRSLIHTLSKELEKGLLVYTELRGSQLFMVFRSDAARHDSLARLPMSYQPPYSTGTGLCILAYADPRTRKAIEAHSPFDEMGAGFWGSYEKMETFLADVPPKGYAEIAAHLPYRVGVPVFDQYNNLIGSLGYALHDTMPDEDQKRLYREKLLQGVRELTINPED